MSLTNKAMLKLELIHDPQLQQAAGAVLIAHGQLEHTLHMTVKTLSGLSIEKSLDATRNMKAWELRDNIKKLFNQKTTDRVSRLNMLALINKTEELSIKRNKLIHRPWLVDGDGNIVVKDENHNWGAPPTPLELTILSSQIRDIALEINTERLEGFIKKVVNEAQ